MSELAQHLINGLTIGGIYVLMALGLTLVYGVLRMLHFAHGLVIALGAYGGWWVIVVAHQPFLLALAAAMLSGAIAGALIERIAYRPLGYNAPLALLISGVGVAIMGEDLLNHIARPERRPMPSPLAGGWTAGSLTISHTYLLVLGITVVLLLLSMALLRYTRFGLAVRATSVDRETSRLMGVDVRAITLRTFIIGSALAGAAGLLVSIAFNVVYPSLGTFAGGKAFAVVVMGGLGSIEGTIYAGLALGIIESLLIGYFHIAIERDAIAFIALILFLLIRPSGFISNIAEQRA